MTAAERAREEMPLVAEAQDRPPWQILHKDVTQTGSTFTHFHISTLRKWLHTAEKAGTVSTNPLGQAQMHAPRHGRQLCLFPRFRMLFP